MTSDPEWSPCDSGTLANISQNTNDQTAAWTRRGAVAAMMATVAGGSWLAVHEEKHGSLRCDRVSELAAQYVAGILLPDLMMEIDVHRRHCQSCNTKLEQMETRRTKS